MSIPSNQFRRDHSWTRFVLLESSAGPVPSQAKVTHSLTISLKKKSNYAHAEALSFLEKSWHGFARFTVVGPVYCEVR